MNEPKKHTLSDELIFRLVDGQLDPQEYRRVLRELEQTPHGWRRCAIAFLEEQALRQEMQQIDFNHQPVNPPPTPDARTSIRHPFAEMISDATDSVGLGAKVVGPGSAEVHPIAVADRAATTTGRSAVRPRAVFQWLGGLAFAASVVLASFLTFHWWPAVEPLVEERGIDSIEIDRTVITRSEDSQMVSATVPVRQHPVSDTQRSPTVTEDDTRTDLASRLEDVQRTFDSWILGASKYRVIERKTELLKQQGEEFSYEFPVEQITISVEHPARFR